ncbi:hypothetical protein DY000_02040153 [Brassica cretica]|uniref:Uncharacterized protein n=1 Tax=Brassica cretica TaxID=69181 RepID=A0ABQ7BGP7_BRACR|nr:hypothetical protein DY000_02040153 [Brassica cretica]
MRGHSIQKWRIRIRRRGKIESRRVLAERGHNTLQGRTVSKEPDVEHTKAGDSTGTQQEKGWNGSLELCRTISGSVDGNEGNAPETHGTSNGTHGDVGNVDMCVLNPVPGNPGRIWGRGGC